MKLSEIFQDAYEEEKSIVASENFLRYLWHLCEAEAGAPSPYAHFIVQDLLAKYYEDGAPHRELPPCVCLSLGEAIVSAIRGFEGFSDCEAKLYKDNEKNAHYISVSWGCSS